MLRTSIMFIMLDANVNLFLKEFEQKILSYHSNESCSVDQNF